MTLLHRLQRLVSETVSPSPSDLPDRIAFVLVLVLALVGAVLGPSSLSLPAAGGVYPAAEGLLFNVLAFLAACAAFLSRTSPRSLRYLSIPFSAALGMALLGIAQLLPLPEGVLQQIASVNLQIYHETAEILTLFGRAPTPARISIAPRQTAAAVLEILAAIGLFLAASAVLRTRRRRRAVFWTVAVGSLVPLGAAAIRAAASPVRADGAAPVGTVFGIAVLAALGILWAEILTSSDRALDAVEPAERFERRFPPLAVRCLLLAACSVGIALSRSWVTAAAAIASVALVLVMGLSRRRAERARRLGVAAGAVAGLAGFATAVFAPSAQAQSASPGAADPDVLRTALDAWRQFPIVGAGLGAFADAFRRVQPTDLVGYFEQARSAPLQILVTGGAVGLALAATVVVSLLVLLARAWRSQKHREESALALAGFGALLFWTLEGLGDFHAGAASVPLLLSALLGAAWAAGQARGRQAS
jgi:O-antigen ligase